jgi:hypothetical protein
MVVFDVNKKVTAELALCKYVVCSFMHAQSYSSAIFTV